MVMRPTSLRCGHSSRMCAASAAASAGSTPPFWSSADVFTWTYTPRGSSLCASLAAFSLFASFTESTLSTAHRFGTPCTKDLHLLLCSWPMKCQRMSPGRTGALPTSSCTCESGGARKQPGQATGLAFPHGLPQRSVAPPQRMASEHSTLARGWFWHPAFATDTHVVLAKVALASVINFLDHLCWLELAHRHQARLCAREEGIVDEGHGRLSGRAQTTMGSEASWPAAWGQAGGAVVAGAGSQRPRAPQRRTLPPRATEHLQGLLQPYRPGLGCPACVVCAASAKPVPRNRSWQSLAALKTAHTNRLPGTLRTLLWPFRPSRP